ncbi:MAG: cytochrome C oxidase subunit IV [Chloroflexi bacterium]|nr:cytochrome C oxidase subunit IV [Chloroflexota bacterium]MQG05410.1 cytochrome C oxidase subunit IV [SAR202 cluster bacterium]
MDCNIYSRLFIGSFPRYLRFLYWSYYMSDMDKTHSAHPSPRKYLMVASALVVLTAIEVGIFYVESLGKGIIPILFILSAFKFALVGMFYMHLRYDSRLFSIFFITGLVLASLVTLALMTLFGMFN